MIKHFLISRYVTKLLSNSLLISLLCDAEASSFIPAPSLIEAEKLAKKEAEEKRKARLKEIRAGFIEKGNQQEDKES